MEFAPDRPFNSLPGLPPRTDLESRAILKACIGAREALASLRQATALIPNPLVLINTIPLLEAQASSEIENIVTTADALFRQAQMDDGAADAATKEAMRYRTALRAGVDMLAKIPLGTRMAEQLCTAIKGAHMTVRRGAGTALRSDATGSIVYTPPEGEKLLRDKLADWERFLHAEDALDPLVRMAVAHYQFEAIHPFTDGNGRTGRILNLLVLIDQGLLDQPVLYLSRFIIRNKAGYYTALREVTASGDWQSWVLYMLAAVEETSRWTLAKVLAARELLDQTAEHVRSRLPKLYSRELVELVFEQPYCRIENLVKAGIAKRQTASVYLQRLAEEGVLQERRMGVQKLFVNLRFLALLTQEEHGWQPFAAAPRRRAKRRRPRRSTS